MLSCSFVVVHASILGNIILLRGRLERVCAIIKGRLQEMENGKSLACTRMYIKTCLCILRQRCFRQRTRITFQRIQFVV